MNDRQIRHLEDISPTQADAWIMYNAGFAESDPEFYRRMGASLYRQDIQERLAALYQRLDEQNAHLDAVSMN